MPGRRGTAQEVDMPRPALSRRRVLQGAAVAVAAPGIVAPSILRAQAAPLALGVLTPLTGAGGFDGPRMLRAMQAVAAEVNAAGGGIGRQVELVVDGVQAHPQ